MMEIVDKLLQWIRMGNSHQCFSKHNSGNTTMISFTGVCNEPKK